MLNNSKKIIYQDCSYKLNGIFFKVHNSLGKYCKEKQYCDAMEKIFVEQKIPHQRELYIKSDNNLVKNNSDRIDFLVFNKIIIEVKAIRFIGRQEYYQIQRYLKSMNIKLGIIVNFHQKHLIPKRIINSEAKE